MPCKNCGELMKASELSAFKSDQGLCPICRIIVPIFEDLRVHIKLIEGD